MSNMEIIFTNPVFKTTIWGGQKLNTQFGYEIPSDTTGECWGISAHENGDCTINGGKYDGKFLSQIWKENPELFGRYASDRFPLLIKIIDAKKDLSIQVHPDNEYARKHEKGSLGKMECWYILDCDDNAEIIIGHHAKTKEELEDMIQNGKWTEFIRKIPVRKGDFFQINPGCVHAITGGLMLLETQQSSDITYRIYDYDRLSDGKPRQLHKKQSIETIQVPFKEPQTDGFTEEVSGTIHKHFITCEYYSVDQYQIDGSFDHVFSKYFTNVSVIEGEGNINGVSVKKGDHFIVTSADGPCKIEGNLNIICSNPN